MPLVNPYGTPGYPPYTAYTYPQQQTTTLSGQPMYQQPQGYSQTGISGRFIANEAEIMPSEVPMNGQPSIFPLHDGSAIIVKSWTSSGTIVTGRYILETPKSQETGIDERLTSIEGRLDALESYRSNRYRNNKRQDRNNEEVSDND